MAIVQIQEGNLWKTYSDAGFKIHGGVPEADYDEAVDGVQREYVETDIPVDEDDEGGNYYEQAGRILLGEEVE